VSEKQHEFLHSSLVCIYAQLLPRIREVGKRLGYAIALHGTMQRDLDLLAAPWAEDAAAPAALVAAVAEEVGGFVVGDQGKMSSGEVSREPTERPHGRLSWNICWGGRPLIDLSVMPRRVQ